MKGFAIMAFLRKFRSCSLLLIAGFFLMCGLAEATVIYTDTMTITGADPTQLGRISRNGVPSDWSGPKAFPGVINTTASYHYMTLDLDLVALESGFIYGGFIQIDFDSTATTTFLSAYLKPYDPSNLATNYLGDPGSSGNPFPGDPLYFQVVVPSPDHLVLVLNETTTDGSGLGVSGGLTVEAFSDTEYTDLIAVSTPVPEPGTWALLACGMAVLVARRFRRG